MQKDIGMDALAKEYDAENPTIFNIIHGTYVAVRGHSLLTEETFRQIKREKEIRNAKKLRSFNDEQEKDIAQKYLSDMTISLKSISKEYNVTTATMRKVLRNQGVIIRRNAHKPRMNCIITEIIVIEIRSKYQTEQYTYKELAEAYGLSIGTVAHIIKRRTWKHVK